VSADAADFVRRQYETPDNLRARKDAYVNAQGDDPREFVVEAIAAAKPSRLLEVGGGEGELAERLSRELGVELVGIDQSEAMVASSARRASTPRRRRAGAPVRGRRVRRRRRGLDALPRPDLDRGLAELARVLRARRRARRRDERRRAPAGAVGPRAARVAHRQFTFRSDNGEESCDATSRRSSAATPTASTMDDATVAASPRAGSARLRSCGCRRSAAPRCSATAPSSSPGKAVS
jgi:SAM-dependent methyltransferase